MSQYLPLIGVLVGGLLTFAGGFVAELVRWNRTQAVRWDERRQTAYADYASAVKAETILYLKIANAKGVFPAQNPGIADLPALLPLLTEAEHTRTERFAIVQLIGAAQVVDAAREWQSSVWRLGAILAPEFSGGRLHFEELYDAATTARFEFYLKARVDLGVSSDLTPPISLSDWTTRWSVNGSNPNP
ncbi:hypothetical protein LTV02_35225 [Nocardia yamanashiensis]|uniref:hypothetical protein n=1 Tax=Nocardia yamanashiensis TaxID=209247 RepID=UPI001E31D259|nr:hypothetical protein [Nocardia yamanashiensis]UGT41145.1 hypothetical protein LTV02_35225 [Nocardia yamanashiensis]